MSAGGACLTALDFVDDLHAFGHAAENCVAPALWRGGAMIKEAVVAYVNEKL